MIHHYFIIKRGSGFSKYHFHKKTGKIMINFCKNEFLLSFRLKLAKVAFCRYILDFNVSGNIVISADSLFFLSVF